MTELSLYPARSAAERRKMVQDQAAMLGIDDVFIRRLVLNFYQRVRAHALLGPVFEAAIAEADWPTHLERMVDFWASIALNAGRYSGQPVPVHQALTGVHPWHFNLWLALFEISLRDCATHPEAVTYFMVRARRIAQSLELSMFGLPELKNVTPTHSEG